MSGILANSSRLSQLATYIRSNILQETRLVAAKQVMTFFLENTCISGKYHR